jgi:hypothetical protein
MARNNMLTNFWQKVQKDSVSWGSLVLWVVALVVLLMMISMFSHT